MKVSLQSGHRVSLSDKAPRKPPRKYVQHFLCKDTVQKESLQTCENMKFNLKFLNATRPYYSTV